MILEYKKFKIIKRMKKLQEKIIKNYFLLIFFV